MIRVATLNSLIRPRSRADGHLRQLTAVTALLRPGEWSCARGLVTLVMPSTVLQLPFHQGG